MPRCPTTIIGVVVALAVSLLGPFLAASSAAGRADGLGAGRVAVGQTLNWIGLITGDQVAIDSTGSLVAVRPAPGRERIRLTAQQTGNHLYVVPADAAALIACGLVDRRLFDVALLARPEYRQQNAAGLAIIVTYRDHSRPHQAFEGIQVEHTYTSINGEALTITKPTTAWPRLTTDRAVKKIWLNAVPAGLSRVDAFG